MTPSHFLFRNKLCLKKTYGVSPETKREKVVITTAPVWGVGVGVGVGVRVCIWTMSHGGRVCCAYIYAHY